MQLTLKQLENALAPITEIGQEELTFMVNGIPVVIRALTPEEDAEVQKFAMTEAGDTENVAVVLSVLERFKLGVLSHAIIAVGNQGFREDFIELEGETVQGKKVRIPRYEAVRKLIVRWPGAIRTALFRKYAELLAIVEQKTDAAIPFEPTDKAAEVERLERQLSSLKAEIDTGSGTSGFSNMVKTIASTDDEPESVLMPVSEPESEPVQTPVTGIPVARKPIIPEAATPPEVHQPVQVQSTPQQNMQEPPVKNIPAQFHDSIVDLTDPDAVEEAMQEEMLRISAMRRAAAATPPRLSRPPHLDAAEVSNQLPTGAVQAGEHYRMPVQELSTQTNASKIGNLVDQPGDSKPSQNPRFVSPKKL